MATGASGIPTKISWVSLTSLVVANMVGTGVFTSLGYQVGGLKSGFVLLSLWAIGGICALCGALCYAELGTMMRRSGGEYNFLTQIYSKPVGFLAGWVSATAGFAAPVALAAMAFGGYLHASYPSLNEKVMGVGIISTITCLHLLRPKIGQVFQNSFTLAKVILILVIIAIGVFHPAPQPVSFMFHSGDGAQFTSSSFAISLVFVMYAYSGWNASTYVVSEVENPQRDIPRSLGIGTALVMVLYLGLNWTFLWTTPMADLVGKKEVGLIAAKHMLGPFWGSLMGGAIALLLISTISSMIRVGPRVTKTMGEDYRPLRLLAVTNQHGIPYRAVLFQSGLSVLLVMTGTFDHVLVYAQCVLLLCTFLAALGVVILRLSQPDTPRPFRTWGYPLTPTIFLVTTGWMILYVVKDKPTESIMGVLTLLLGLGVYLLPRGIDLVVTTRTNSGAE